MGSHRGRQCRQIITALKDGYHPPAAAIRRDIADRLGQPAEILGLPFQPGQRIELRYLIRAAAVKSANDAATVIGEGLAGSEAKFAAQMTQMARALGMNNTQFRNANGLTASGHYSTARDMTTLGRRLFYDFPQYYSIFSRRSTS